MKVRRGQEIKDNLPKLKCLTTKRGIKASNEKIFRSKSEQKSLSGARNINQGSKGRKVRNKIAFQKRDVGVDKITLALEKLKNDLEAEQGAEGDDSKEGATDRYLNGIQNILLSLSIHNQIRIKAAKHLFKTITENSNLWEKPQIRNCVRVCIIDGSTTIRDVMIDIIGFSIMNNPKAINDHYVTLAGRILDKNVSVRKRVIKIFGDFCISHKTHEQVPEIYSRIIKRMQDPEPSVVDLITNIMEKCWTPTAEEFGVINLTLNIVDAVAILEKDNKLETLNELLKRILRKKEYKEEHNKTTKCLISYFGQLKDREEERASGILTTLKAFVKADETHVEENITRIKELIDLEGTKNSEILAKKFDLLRSLLPYLKKDKEFLKEVEKQTTNIILQRDKSAIDQGMSLLHELTKLTENHKIIEQAITYCFSYANVLKDEVEKYIPPEDFASVESQCKRTLYILGTLIKYFKPDIKSNKILILLLQFLNQESEELQLYSLKALGSISLRYTDVSLNEHIKRIYHFLLRSKKSKLKLQVLNNVELFLENEQNFESNESGSLKETDEGLLTSVILEYINDILDAYFTTRQEIRSAVARVVFLIIDHGIVHFSKIVPHLICMTVDKDSIISRKSYEKLEEIDCRYSMMVYTTAVNGFRLSYRYLKLFTENVKGYFNYEAVHSPLYTILRKSKKQQRAFVLNLLHKFEDKKISEDLLEFYAQNLAYFPYATYDEVLFVLYTVNAMIAVSGYESLTEFVETGEKTIFIILLALSKHLQEQYEIPDELIINYSPWSETRTYDRILTRKTEITMELQQEEELRAYASQWQENWEPAAEDLTKLKEVLETKKNSVDGKKRKLRNNKKKKVSFKMQKVK